ncbi:MAG: amidohydrolase [Thermoplasmata archaeon]|nr:amidohydrolase [Thermoplasmata archaeon]
MTEPTFIENARFALTMDRDHRVQENCSLRVEGGTIADIGQGIKKVRGDEVVDARGCILMPGLVNSHTHSSMVALRGLNDDAPLEEWLGSMWKMEGKLTGEVAELASEWAFLEMICSGTTSCMDMYEAWEAAKAAKRVGIRMANGPAIISIFGPPSDRLADAERFISEFDGDDLITPIVNLHSIYTNDEDTIRKAADLSIEKNVILHAHGAETRKEIFDNRNRTGRLAVEELDHCGALHDRTAIAHLGWASSWEFNRMVEKGASAVHCPTSNQKLGTGGFFPYRDLKEKGMTIGLGTDGAASNNSLDMFREMRSMALIQKMQYWDPTAGTARDALTCAVKGGNEILGLNGGTLEKGSNADVVLMRIDPTIMPLGKEKLESALVYSATGALVRGTMVNGEWAFIDGRLGGGGSCSQRLEEIIDRVSDELFT